MTCEQDVRTKLESFLSEEGIELPANFRLMLPWIAQVVNEAEYDAERKGFDKGFEEARKMYQEKVR